MVFRVITEFDGTGSDSCISLEVGDVITKVYRLDSDVLIGTNTRSGENGAFPASCVQGEGGDTALPLPGHTASRDALHDKVVYSNVTKYIKEKEQLQSDKNGKDHVSPTPEKDRHVRFSDVRLEHSISVPESTASWQESFEESFRDKLSNYDNIEVKPAESKTHKSDGTYHRLQKFNALVYSSTEKIFLSGRDENRVLKRIFGACIGVVAGALLFVVTLFMFDYTKGEAGIITAIFTLVFCVCLAFSTHCRCIVALVVPSFCTNKGRALLLSMLFSLILTHAGENIGENAKVTGSSFACVVELAANQSRELQKQLAAPVKDLKAYIDRQQEVLRSGVKVITDSFKDVRNALNQADNAVEDTKKSIDAVRQVCRANVDKLKTTCDKVCTFGIICGSGFCDNLVALPCNSLQITDNALTEAARNARKHLDEALNYFHVDLNISSDFNASTNTSGSFKDIQKEIDEDISSKTRGVFSFLKVFKKVLSLSLLLIFAQSVWYLRNYLAKDGYDNIYITSQLKELDEGNKKIGKDSILPLKKKEHEKYVDTTSIKLSSCELSSCKLGLIQVLLHFIICLVIIAFDVAIFYILEMVRKQGDVELEVKGQGHVTVEVQGKGPVADFYRILITGLNVDQNYSANINISECLPNAIVPEFTMIPVYIICYIVTVLSVILQGYGLRLRRKISAYYYPEQERARLDYLHKKIRHKRVGFLRFIRQQVLSTHKESQVKEKLRLSTWLMFKIPFLAKILPQREKLECLSCEQTEGSFSSVKLRKCKGESGGMDCDAVYCEECWKALGDNCPLCCKDEVVLRD
ncbi:DC-STAMP domain-containing protein 2-like [Mya arenaria]|uniref:DC-STAMP domain-containing protein 2-like n=1 Tax=Mya arenaria TaxID=6604 RepID=UPI0022DEE9AA|nr:DC-STAMP domain-containing protein 2-like [Mya arenaria]